MLRASVSPDRLSEEDIADSIYALKWGLPDSFSPSGIASMNGAS